MTTVSRRPPRAWVEVNLRRVQANVQSLSTLLSSDCSLMAVVKADAYGHGLLPVARAALQAGACWLGVATVEEGADLRTGRILAPIALLCMPAIDQLRQVILHGLTPVIGDRMLVDALAAIRGKDKIDVHLEVDTGMGRAGIFPENAVDLWRRCAQRGLRVNGLCTHFADADGPDPKLSIAQWARFTEARRTLNEAGADFDWVHAGNSAAALRFPLEGCNLVRPGLLMYGLDIPCSGTIQPVLALRARVGAVRELPAGHTISYGATYRLARPSRVATVLIGYGDGYPRRLSNRGEMLIRGCRAPILGRVCMDQTVVDVTEIPAAAAGDTATCIGSDGSVSISADVIARQIDTTVHEVTTCLTARLPRLYLDPESAESGG